jgi:hypothetical protein
MRTVLSAALGMPANVAQLVIGSFVPCIALQREPLRMRGGDFYETQQFIRTAFIILGLGLSIGGLWDCGLNGSCADQQRVL